MVSINYIYSNVRFQTTFNDMEFEVNSREKAMFTAFDTPMTKKKTLLWSLRWLILD